MQHQFQNLLEGEDARTTEFKGLAAAVAVEQHARQRRGHVADIDRLHPVLAATDQRQYPEDPRQGGKTVEEIVFRTEHD